MGTEGLFPGVRRPAREADRSPQFSDAWNCIYTNPYVFMAWCLVKHIMSVTISLFVIHPFTDEAFYPAILN